MSMTNEIKEYALDLGYHAVGVAPADPFPQLMQSLAQRKEDYVNFPGLDDYADPRTALPEARSVIVVALDYHTEAFPPELVGKICRFHMSRVYVAGPQRMNGARAEMMRQFLQSKGLQVGPWPQGRSWISAKQAAVRSGVGQFGRNTLIYVPNIGTFLTVLTWVVDKELEYDTPNSNQVTHCPPGCNLCRLVCPTGALTTTGAAADQPRLNPRRCLTLNTIRNRGGESGLPPYIPREIRPKVGTWLHGCDICQQVCPRNQAKLGANLPVNAYLAKKAAEFDLVRMLHMTEEYYQQTIRPIMYTHIKPHQQEILRRNAAVVLGNIGDPASVPALIQALDDPAETVRAHAAWALGRIGGAAARQGLEAQRQRETGEIARQEVEDALAEMTA